MSKVLAIGPFADHEMQAHEAQLNCLYVKGPNDISGLDDATRAGIQAVAYKGHHAFGGEQRDLLPNLGIGANYGVGYDAIDVAAASERGIKVTNTPDVLNDAVAEMTFALMIALCHGQWRQWDAIVADARRHRSPNAGWPEAATARAIDSALAGPRAYDGQMRDYPFVNAHGRKRIGASDVTAACRVLWRVWTVMVVSLALIAVVLG